MSVLCWGRGQGEGGCHASKINRGGDSIGVGAHPDMLARWNATIDCHSHLHQEW